MQHTESHVQAPTRVAHLSASATHGTENLSMRRNLRPLALSIAQEWAWLLGMARPQTEMPLGFQRWDSLWFHGI